MSKPQFVYVTYIAATPERVWSAMTEPAFTLRFFYFRLDGVWTPGAAFSSVGKDGRVDHEGVIVECDPPRRLSLRWSRARIGGELKDMPPMVATCVLEPLGDVVRLTITETHDEPVDESYLDGGRAGWPVIASELKTVVETGRFLPRFPMAV